MNERKPGNLAYADLGKRLADLGFGPGREWQDPICRFRSARGRGDVLASHDLVDVLAVINGRPELASEVRASDAEARSFIVKSINGMMASDAFRNAAPGLVDARDPSRLPIVWKRLETIAAIGERRA
jgi:hypothetical protein